MKIEFRGEITHRKCGLVSINSCIMVHCVILCYKLIRIFFWFLNFTASDKEIMVIVRLKTIFYVEAITFHANSIYRHAYFIVSSFFSNSRNIDKRAFFPSAIIINYVHHTIQLYINCGASTIYSTLYFIRPCRIHLFSSRNDIIY